MNKVYYSVKKLNSEKLLLDFLKEHAKTEQSVCAWNLLFEKFYSVFKEYLKKVEFLSSGKPYCKQGFISISHSDTAVAVAFSKDCETAVDIELIKPNFPEKVARFIGNLENSEELYRVWTKREAVIKAKIYSALKNDAEKEFLGINKIITINEKAFSLSIYGENAEFIKV